MKPEVFNGLNIHIKGILLTFLKLSLVLLSVQHLECKFYIISAFCHDCIIDSVHLMCLYFVSFFTHVGLIVMLHCQLYSFYLMYLIISVYAI